MAPDNAIHGPGFLEKTAGNRSRLAISALLPTRRPRRFSTPAGILSSPRTSQVAWTFWLTWTSQLTGLLSSRGLLRSELDFLFPIGLPAGFLRFFFLCGK